MSFKMKIKLLMRSSSFKRILDERLKEIDLESQTIDKEKSLSSQLSDSEIIVNGTGKIDKSVIDLCPNLLMVQQAGIGYDNVDVDYCTSKSIFVANVPLANAISVAEHTLFLMMYLAKNIRFGNLKSSELGTELQGKTLLIIGLGATGTEVAKRAKAFGMHVIAVTKEQFKPGREKSFFVDNIHGPEALSENISRADFISLHVPLTEQTREMIGTAELGIMKKSAFLINVARAGVVSRDALFEALSRRRIAGAAFDVFWDEPADPSDRLLQLDNFFLTPHIAGWTKESIDSTTRIIAANIRRVLEGSSPLTLVNTGLLR